MPLSDGRSGDVLINRTEGLAAKSGLSDFHRPAGATDLWVAGPDLPLQSARVWDSEKHPPLGRGPFLWVSRSAIRLQMMGNHMLLPRL